MIYAFCHLSIIPVRAEHSDPSEIVTQMLFGEKCTIIEEYNQWRKIRLKHDDYEGWVDEKQLWIIPMEDFNDDAGKSYITNQQLEINGPNGAFTIVRGSILYRTSNESQFKIGKFNYEISNPLHKDFSSIGETAKSYLNSPYLWGGRSPYGIDCSGFTQLVFRFYNIELKRDASQQVHQGEVLSFDRIESGDLVFFENDSNRIHHVGIYLGNNEIIHAHGQVRIDSLSLTGITNKDTGKLTHRFHGIRRVV